MMDTNFIPYGQVIDMVGDEYYQLEWERFKKRPWLDASYYYRMEKWIENNFNCWPDHDKSHFIFHDANEALVFRLRYSA